MSPEQLRGDPFAVDARTDVHALGLMLFELLSGRRPYDQDGRSLLEVARTVETGEPTRLGTVVPDCRGDLDAIVGKSLAKDRAGRYPSAAALAEDLGRHLRHEPVLARPPRVGYLANRFVRRHSALCAGIAIAFLGLLTGLGIALWQLRHAREAEAVAERRRAVAEEESIDALAARDFLQEVLVQAAPEQNLGGTPTLKDAVRLAATRVDADLASHLVVRAAVHHTLGRCYRGLGEYVVAENHLRQSLELYEQRYGPKHLKLSMVRVDLASVLSTLSRDEEAESVLEQALALREAKNPKDRRLLATGLNSLGIALYNRGKLPAARERLLAALEITKSLDPELRHDEATIETNLGMLCQNLGDSLGAERHFREALAAHLASGRTQNPLTAKTLEALAELLHRKKERDEALELIDRAIIMLEETVGKDHERLVSPLQTKGEIRFAQGAREEGLSLSSEGHRLALSKLGPNHMRTLRAQYLLGGLKSVAGETSAAEELLLDAATRASEHVGRTHPMTVEIRISLAVHTSRAGSPEKANALIDELDADFTRAGAKNKPKLPRFP